MIKSIKIVFTDYLYCKSTNDMKKTVKKDIAEMKNLVNSMPKSINESIAFEADDDFNEYDEETPEEEPVEEPEMEEEPSQADASAHAAQLIDDIRKKALRAMADLADTPEDENYIMLKKVWQMTDRKPEQQNQQQAPNKPMQPMQ